MGGYDGAPHGWFEAGRQLLQQRPWRGPAPQAKLDQRVMSLVSAIPSLLFSQCTPFLTLVIVDDLSDTCSLIVAPPMSSQSWHPRERLLAVGADSTLYIHSEGA